MELYRISGFKDGFNYCLEIATPYEKRFKVFPTYAGCKEYLDNFVWHLKMTRAEWEIEVMDIDGIKKA